MLADAMVAIIIDELHDTSLSSRAYTWINKVQEDLNSRAYWCCLEVPTPAMMSLLAPVTTGTCSVAAGSTAVVGTGTSFTSAHVGQIITFGTDDNYYFISAVADTTHLTLAAAYLGTTDTAATFAIDFLTYALPTDVSIGKIKSIVIQNPHSKLKRVDQAERDEMMPNLIGGRGRPFAYLDWGETSIQPHPLPDTDYLLVVRYQKTPDDVSATATTFDWPSQYHNAILTGALALGWDWKDDQQMSIKVRADYEALIAGHLRNQNRHTDYHPQLRSFDEQTGWPRLQLGRNISS